MRIYAFVLTLIGKLLLNNGFFKIVLFNLFRFQKNEGVQKSICNNIRLNHKLM